MVRTRADRGTLFVDLHHAGTRLRRYTNLPDTPRNRTVVADLGRQLADDLVSPPLPRFADFVAIWTHACGVGWRRSYRDSIDSLLRKHLLPTLGHLPIDRIDRAAVLTLRAQLSATPARRPIHGERPPDLHAALTPLGSATVNRILGLLNQILGEASERHGIANPLLGVRRLRVHRTDIQPFKLEELRQLIDTAPAEYREYLTLRAFTGLRTAEVHGLRWRHVDFERRQLLIRETWADGQRSETKNDGSRREVTMTDPVLAALKTLHARRLPPLDPDAPVFCSTNGAPVDNHNFIRRVWRPLLRQLGLPLRRPYQLRHSAATYWLAAGENPLWIARQLGHTTTEMLFRTYGRYVPNLTRRDGSAIEQLVRQAFPASSECAAPPSPVPRSIPSPPEPTDAR